MKFQETEEKMNELVLQTKKNKTLQPCIAISCLRCGKFTIIKTFGLCPILNHAKNVINEIKPELQNEGNLI